jgi:hypothetical protein
LLSTVIKRRAVSGFGHGYNWQTPKLFGKNGHLLSGGHMTLGRWTLDENRTSFPVSIDSMTYPHPYFHVSAPTKNQEFIIQQAILFHPGDYIADRKQYLFPPPPENYNFSPSCVTSFFDSHRGVFALILPYFAFILPFYFPVSHFLPLSSFFFSLSSFFLFPLFLFNFSYFFPQMTLADIFPSPGGGGYFPMYSPLLLS